MVQIGEKCCVDLNNNMICDIEETEEKSQEQEIVIEEVPEEKITEQEELPLEEAEAIEETPEITAEVVAEEPVIKVESPNSETYQFIELYENKQLGYQYIYNTEWHKVKQNKIKIDLNMPKKYTPIEIQGKTYPIFFVDTIYLDRNKQEAKGYCEKDPTCFGEDIMDISLPLNYDEFKDKTPDEWMYEYGPKKPSLFEERKYYIKGKQTTRAIYPTETGEIRVYYDPKTGLVIRIENQIGEHPMQLTEYFDLTAGTVRDVDVIHRTKDEIPPEEAFYSTR